MGFIPLPEMTNIGDTRDNARKILLCRRHYFEDKEKCFYVVPFDRDDDPVDSFMTKVGQKHRRLRHGNNLKFKPPKHQDEETLDPIILEDFPKPGRIRNTNRGGIPKNIGFRKDFDPTAEKPKLLAPKNGNSKRPSLKVHFREDDQQAACGLPLASTTATTDMDALTCKHCRSLVIKRYSETLHV